MKISLVAAVAGLLLSMSAFAGELDRRADAEQARINEGVRSGELTRPEARRLESRELHMRREIARDRAFGGLTAGERARINRQENRLSRSIYAQKHDCQVRY
jgi:hypothetical protein